MTLNNLLLTHRANQYWQYSGMDSPDQCFDPQHFNNFPHTVEYHYNSRGFRDHEWPSDDLDQAIWCLGDSFTVGLGSPFLHTWPQVLQRVTNRRVINISLDGGSNDWLARRAQGIAQEIRPRTMAIMWTYINRRENDLELMLNQTWNTYYDSIKDPAWPSCDSYQYWMHLPWTIKKEIWQKHQPLPDVFQLTKDLNMTPVPNNSFDEDRRLHFVQGDDIENFKYNVESVQAFPGTTTINLAIPGFASKDQQNDCVKILQAQGNFVPLFDKMDLARDGHHFDLITSEWIAQEISALL